jgi:hypothetical protein
MHRPPPELHFCNSEGKGAQNASPDAAFFPQPSFPHSQHEMVTGEMAIRNHFGEKVARQAP